MIRLRLATSDGFQEITPATSSHCEGCQHAVQRRQQDLGKWSFDPYYHCDLYDQRTDGKRLWQCIRAANPVIVESLRAKAEQYEGYSRTVEVPFPQEHLRNLSSEIRWPLVYHTLRFKQALCICDTHDTFFAVLLPGEKPRCPSCIQAWLDEMRYVLFHILARALAHLHRERMDAEHGALRVGRLPASMLYPDAEWVVLGENPSWNPPKE
jgi:hypothetical protein